MAVLFPFALIAFIIQSVVLFGVHNRKLQFLSFFLLELFPVSGVLYYAIKQPSISYLGWEFAVSMCLWLAGAVLVGCLLAWGIYTFSKR